MSMTIPAFTAKASILINNQFLAWPTRTADITATVAALGSDTTKHAFSQETPAAALQVLPANNIFVNDLNLLINRGHAGGLNSNQMLGALDDVAAIAHAPVNVDIPYVTGATANGSILSCTQGTWTGNPTSKAYQWKSAAANVGTNSPSYTTVAGDVGKVVTCVVTATNATGSGTAPPSNGITVT